MGKVVAFPEWRSRMRNAEKKGESQGEYTDQLYAIADDLTKRGWEIDMHSRIIPAWCTYVDPIQKKIWHHNAKANLSAQLFGGVLEFVRANIKAPAVFLCLPESDVLHDTLEGCIDFGKIFRLDRELDEFERDVVWPWGLTCDSLEFLPEDQAPKHYITLNADPSQINDPE